MFWSRAVALCLLVTAVADLCSGLMLERLPRHIPRSKIRISHDTVEDDDVADSYDTSVEKKRIVQDPMLTDHIQSSGQLAPFIMKPTWKAIYPFSQNKRVTRSHKKRETSEESEMSERDQKELANILKDDDEAEMNEKKKKNEKKEASRHNKTKRQSSDEPMPQDLKDSDAEDQEPAPPTQDFQDWLRREYYRNMAKSFASMRRKRDGSSSYSKKTVKRAKKSIQSSSTSLSEITDNLRNIEDQLFQDALQTMREGGEDYEDDVHKQNRIFNDLNLAYDLETMRNAFFRLRETLGNMENEEDEEMYHSSNRKRSRQCPALDTLTSDCTTLSDIMPDGPLKRLLLRACNWHEVCYTCGKTYGLTSESCDGSFIEQTQTICRNDAPCESTASLLVVPLRQRRVFYKRSNPDVCVEEPCVEAFLKEGLAAMEEGRYALRDNYNAIRQA